MVDVLGEGLEDTLNKRMRSAKAPYLDVWSPLVSALLDAGFAEQTGAAGAIKAGIGAVKGTGGTERRETKDRFVRFHEALEEVEALHAHARIDENDLELRERLRSEVERMVVPTYAKFVQKHRKDNCTSRPFSRLLICYRACMLIALSRSDQTRASMSDLMPTDLRLKSGAFSSNWSTSARVVVLYCKVEYAYS